MGVPVRAFFVADRWYCWRAAFKSKTLEVTLSLAPSGNLTWSYVKAIGV